MAKDVFESSDRVRTARPLRYVQSVTFDKPLGLEYGGTLLETIMTKQFQHSWLSV